MVMYARPVRYNQEKEADFQETLKARVEDYFAARGGNKKANALMWAKMAAFFTSYWIFWASLALFPHSLGVTAALLLGLVFATMAVAFTICHDAVHGTLSNRRWVNDSIFWFSFNMFGPNAYLWKIRHNNAHHLFVNIPGSDLDVEGSKLLRISPHVPWKPIHRYQHLYCSFMYMIFTLHWVFFKDFKIFRMKEFGNVTGLQHSPWRLVEMIAFKLAYVGYMILLPMAVLPYSPGQILGTFVVFHLILSYLLLMTFAASHVAMDSHFVTHGESGQLPHSFLEHQLLTSVDFHAQNRLAGLFYGGFNSHVAHHMFPAICSVHYTGLTKVIQDTAMEFRLPYRELSLPALWLSHYRYLKEVGRSQESGDRFLLSLGESP